MTALAGTAAKAATWSLLEIGARYGVQVAVTVALARLLGPAEFGALAIILIFTSIGAVMVNSGLGAALIQRRDPTPSELSSVFAFSAALGGLLALVLASAAPALTGFFGVAGATDELRVLAIVLAIGGLGVVPDALLTTRLRFRARARVQLVASTVSGTAAITLAWSGFGLWSLVVQLLVATTLRVAGLWIASGWRPNCAPSLQSFRPLAGFGGFIFLSMMANTLHMQFQSAVIGKLFDPRALGFFTVAQNAHNAPAAIAGEMLSKVGLSTFSRLAGRPEELADALRGALSVSMFLFFPAMLGLAVAAEPLVVLVYGETWRPMAPVLALLALSKAFWPLHVLNQEVLNAMGRSALVFRLTLAKSGIGIALVSAGAQWGPVGVAAALLVASIVNMAINAKPVGRVLGVGLGRQLGDLRSVVVLSLLAAAVAWFALSGLGTGMGGLAAAAFAGSATYVAGAMILRPKAYDSARRMISRAFAPSALARQDASSRPERN